MRQDREPIAIVGIGCRFPQASGPAEFWDLLVNGRDAIEEIPASRFDVNALYDATPAQPGRINTRWGGFLRDIDRFDARFFGISGREADRLDPQQRLLLEVAWEAFEDAGIPPDGVAGASAAVFVGMWLNDYETRLFRNPSRIDFYMTTGTGRYSASGRLSYMFGLQGPSVTLDCACSSSLVAVHLACHSLWAGETEFALAGGANVILEPSITIAYSQSRMMAPDGRCKFGDARANGYVRSEGAAVVLLKPLARAIADQDRIYATIIGSAVNNDGRSSGFLATPAQGGQEEMLRKAYRDAGVSPGDVQYVEAHGTGTHAGDPVEIQALGSVLREGRRPGAVCRIGSVKTNVGHTEGAAGVAGLIKVALSVKNRALPPSLHFEQPNPDIPWESLPVQIQRELEPWPDSPETPIGGVSSFGIAGTNAHIVLAGLTRASHDVRDKPDEASAPCLVPVSAQSPAALKALATAYARAARADSNASLPTFARTAALRRAHMDERLAVVVSSRAELATQLDAWVNEQSPAQVCAGRRDADGAPKIAFVFPGQGAQWLGMGRELMRRHPGFRAALEDCDRAIRTIAGWSVIDELQAEGGRSRLDRIDVIQPVLFSVQVALAELWRSWGIEPDAVVGHSMGEVAAARVANVLTTDEAALVICERSRLMHRTSGHGAMALIGLSVDDTRVHLAGRDAQISIAVSNSPRSTVISGDPAGIDAVLAELERRDVFCRRVKVDVASHSPQMDPLCGELISALEAIAPHAGSIPVYSTVSAARIDGEHLDARYWGRNLRQPVMFSAAVERLIAAGHSTFIEMSPHPLLAPALQELLQDAGRQGLVLASTRREEPEEPVILGSLGTLYVHGYGVRWNRLYAPGPWVALPTYAWDRERHWLDVPQDRASASAHAAGAHPLLGARLDAPIPTYEAELGPATLQDVSPASFAGSMLIGPGALVETALAAANELHRGGKPLVNISFPAAIPVAATDDETRQLVDTVVFDDGEGTASFRIFALTASEPAREWTLAASGQIASDGEASGPMIRIDIDELRRRAGDAVSGDEWARMLAAKGIDLGERSSAVREIRRAGSELLVRMEFASLASPSAERVGVGPAALDISLLALASLDAASSRVMVPARIASFARHGAVAATGWAYATVTRSGPGPLIADLQICDDNGVVSAAVRGIEMVPVRAASFAHAHRASTAEWHYEVRWEEPAASKIREQVTASQGSVWVLLAGSSGATDGLRRTLEARGAHVVEVHAGTGFEAQENGHYTVAPGNPADYVRVTEHLRSRAMSPRQVVHVAGLDHEDPDRAVAEAATTCAALVAAQQGFRIASPDAPPRLWVVTRGAQACSAASPVDVASAALWGLGRVIALEQPEAWGGLVDLDAAGDAGEIDRLVAHLLGEREEGQVAFRDGRARVPRLARVAPPTGSSARLRGNATYLVTGGLGQLGVRVARWLAESGGGHILLVGRHGLPPRHSWESLDPSSPAVRAIAAIRDMESFGARVTVEAVDVADRGATEALLARCGTEWPPLKGIVHAAGVIDTCAIDRLDAAQFAAALRGKAEGAWVLHRATESLHLDFFALFSSASATWGSRGLGHYAAANAVLDGIAHFRRAHGLPATAVNWGWWHGGGTAAAVDEFFATIGLSAMPADAAIGVLGDLLATDVPQRVVAPVDWSVFKPIFAATGARLLEHIEVTAVRTPPGGRNRGELRRQISGHSAAEARDLVMQHVRAQVADVLGRELTDADMTRGFFKMGMDSLMTVEVRRRLEVTLDRALPATIAFEYPTIAALSAYLCGTVLDTPSDDTAGDPVRAPEPQLESALADRSTDELATLLDQELGQILGQEGRAD